MKIVTLLISVLMPFSAMATNHLNQKFTVSCTIHLLGTNGASLDDQKTSAPDSAAGAAVVSFDLGDYVLGANLMDIIPNFKAPNDDMPNLEMGLSRKSQGPIVGQVNEANVAVDIQVGESRSVSSRSFLTMTYKSAPYSRVDYTCTATRVE